MRRGLRRIKAIAGLALLLVGGCGGGSGDDSVPPGTLEGDAATQAAILVAQSTIALLVGLRTQPSSLNTLGGGCFDGSVDGTCRVANGESISDGSFDQCVFFISGGSDRLTVDGGIRVTTSDPNTCVTGFNPSATLDIRYRNLLQILRDSNDAELVRVRADGSDRIVPAGPGCSGFNVFEQIDATIDTVVNTRISGRLLADGTDAELHADDVTMNQTSAGSPCERTVLVDGDMEVDDRANAIRYAQTLEGVSMIFTEANDAARVAISGIIDNDCLGRVTLATPEALVMRNATDCPTAGALRITIDGRTSEARFNGGSFSLDYGADGVVEVTGSDCRAIAQCAG